MFPLALFPLASVCVVPRLRCWRCPLEEGRPATGTGRIPSVHRLCLLVRNQAVAPLRGVHEQVVVSGELRVMQSGFPRAEIRDDHDRRERVRREKRPDDDGADSAVGVAPELKGDLLSDLEVYVDHIRQSVFRLLVGLPVVKRLEGHQLASHELVAGELTRQESESPRDNGHHSRVRDRRRRQEVLIERGRGLRRLARMDYANVPHLPPILQGDCSGSHLGYDVVPVNLPDGDLRAGIRIVRDAKRREVCRSRAQCLDVGPGCGNQQPVRAAVEVSVEIHSSGEDGDALHRPLLLASLLGLAREHESPDEPQSKPAHLGAPFRLMSDWPPP